MGANTHGPEMAPTSVLVVDDDPKIRSLLQRYLESEGFRVTEAETLKGVCAAFKTHTQDLVLLDVNLKGENGFEIARHIQSHHNAPIILISGKGDVVDRVVGLELGADNYVTKPFHLRELLARIRTVLRRARRNIDASTGFQTAPENASALSERPFCFDGWRYLPAELKLLAPDGETKSLTTSEHSLLTALLSAPGRALTRDQIMDLQSYRKRDSFDRSVDTQIGRLRKKLKDSVAEPQLIKTVRGIGYLFAAKVTRE